MEKEGALPKENLESKTEAVFAEMTKMPEVAEALAILDGLPKNLKYHNKGHTLDVMKEIILFALADRADQRVIRQQVIAAAWHDTGYVKKYEQNEPEAVEMFQRSKAYQNLSDEERKEVIANILDSQMVMRENVPHLLMQRSRFGYVLDADVSNFGRDDYFEKRMSVAEELGIDLSNPEIKKKFFEFALHLLKNHEWKTASAKTLRQAQKEKNITTLEKEYEALTIPNI